MLTIGRVYGDNQTHLSSHTAFHLHAPLNIRLANELGRQLSSQPPPIRPLAPPLLGGNHLHPPADQDAYKPSGMPGQNSDTPRETRSAIYGLGSEQEEQGFSRYPRVDDEG